MKSVNHSLSPGGGRLQRRNALRSISATIDYRRSQRPAVVVQLKRLLSGPTTSQKRIFRSSLVTWHDVQLFLLAMRIRHCLSQVFPGSTEPSHLST